VRTSHFLVGLANYLQWRYCVRLTPMLGSQDPWSAAQSQRRTGDQDRDRERIRGPRRVPVGSGERLDEQTGVGTSSRVRYAWHEQLSRPTTRSPAAPKKTTWCAART